MRARIVGYQEGHFRHERGGATFEGVRTRTLRRVSMAISPWQLALRFGLEVASLVALGRYAGTWLRDPWSVVAAWAVPGAVALFWVTFAVKDDPSRSGNAPIAVPGALRLALELAVFGSGAASLAGRADWTAFVVFMIALVVHHAMTGKRLAWLVQQE